MSGLDDVMSVCLDLPSVMDRVPGLSDVICEAFERAAVICFPKLDGVVMNRKNAKAKLRMADAEALMTFPTAFRTVTVPVVGIMMAFETARRMLTDPSAVIEMTTTLPA